MKIQRMKTNRIVNPLGFDLKTPHVSWTVTDIEAKKQLWARVEVSKTEDFADVIFDTGACKTASSLGVPVEIALEPRTRYFWRVTVMGDNGELVTSDTAWFETAKLDEPFTAQRISPCLAPDTAPYMRRAFEITGEVLSARAYFTGLGIYELYLNGEKANDEYLAPGCTAYDSWIQYQTYDVTDLIHTGENVIGAILGNGWQKAALVLTASLAITKRISRENPATCTQMNTCSSVSCTSPPRRARPSSSRTKTGSALRTR